MLFIFLAEKQRNNKELNPVMESNVDLSILKITATMIFLEFIT